MIYDWLQRKFFKSYFITQSKNQNDLKMNKETEFKASVDQENIYNFPIRKGHRYRYYIPQTQFHWNTIGCLAGDATPRQNGLDINTNEKRSHQLSKIKKLYVFPTIASENKVIAEYELPNSKTGILKEVHPTVRRFFLIPMLPPEDNSCVTKPETKSAETMNEPETKIVETSQSNLNNRDFKLQFPKIEQTCGFKLKTTFGEHDSYGSLCHKDADIDEVSVPSCEQNNRSNDSNLPSNDYFYQNKETEMESQHVSEEWWDDMINFENVGDDVWVEASKVPKCKRTFMLKLKNIFSKIDEKNDLEDINS